MQLSKLISRSLIAAGLVAVLTPGYALADTFNWTFAGSGISGSGTLTATAYGAPGEFDITGGSGTVISSTYGTYAVTFDLCAPAGHVCTIQNSDGAGANETYDNLLFANNTPGSELDDNGVVLAPGPPGSNTLGIEIWDMPSKEFYSYGTGGYESLSTPFTVSSAATPEPSSLILAGSGFLGMFFARKRFV